MPRIPLPEHPSIEHLKNQAKLVQQLVRDGDEGALRMVQEFHPRLGSADSSTPEISAFKRSDAQLTVARLYGFASWARLRAHVAEVEVFARADTADTDPEDEADRFVALGCVAYSKVDVDARIEQANRMLAANPELASASPAAMATTGRHDLLATLIERDASINQRPCGPNQWPPILYCAYSRIRPTEATWSTLATARLLLERGADPNAGFLWRGLVPPFTALTGAFGWGEIDQPPHPEGLALARLLLEAGADPNDGQALYNNGLAGTAHDDPSHLELLTEFGLGTDQSGPWYARFGSKLTPPAELIYDELEIAAHRGLPNRMRFLISLGLDLERGVGRSDETPRRLAAAKGHQAVVDLLTAASVKAEDS